MLRSKIRSCATLLLIIVVTIIPAFSNAAGSNNNEPIDLGILKQKDTLLPFMTGPQKIQYLQLERIIESAHSDLKSGQYLANSKPSSLDPNRDLKPLIERGERMIESAQLKIEDSQKKLVALLQVVQDQQSQQMKADLTRFDYDLESANYDDAITVLSKRLLTTCWELGYETLFFDGVFIQDGESTLPSSAELRNSTYDRLIKIDGTTFSVTIPIDLKLKADSTGKAAHIFEFENAPVFKDDQKALLVIEMIHPKGSSSGLLSLRAIDLETQLIVTHQLIKIKDSAEKLGLVAEGLEDTIPDQLKLRDPANTLETLSNLGDLYTFMITSEFETTVTHELLTHTLLKNKTLQITDSNFILRAYGKSLSAPETWKGQSNAQLTITADEQTGNYQLRAQADNSDRVLPCGTLQLNNSNATTPTEEIPSI
ncbi:hypothetical protein SH580_04240 [Coraliomargarita algicola]|uniref:Uncharacterized protein n=1 Tax=Coraliomargarita algicola TaxID=3092156 RepID=A0ABZ0RL31_9BACT|nr:hypothetical protein [Coraliomargarita sp. J2-16]WPJ96915.1 hypothetical protein SH580_04240 [Coraliomargarita sp. J2-16]